MALFLTLAALWLERPLLASMPLVGILLPQTLWMVDFLGGLAGWHPIGMTEYMFRRTIPLFTRALSFFHFWLPLLLLWLVSRLGYDRRAFVAWTGLAWILLFLCYFFMPAPPPSPDAPNVPVNINYVYGPSDEAAQTWMHPLAWLALLWIGLPVVVFYPTHRLLRRWFKRPSKSAF